MNVSFLDVAASEFNDAVEYYESEQKGLGLRFKTEANRAISRVASLPTAYQLLSERTRRCLIAKFPYGIIYQQLDNEILVVAVAHLHRQPDYWLSRKP